MSAVENPPVYYVFAAEDLERIRVGLMLCGGLLEMPGLTLEDRNLCLQEIVGAISALTLDAKPKDVA